jgi:hypothetical protein
MAVSILGILATSIGIVGIVMFRSMNTTQNRLEETRGPRFASVYWTPDVASTETVNPGADCGAAGPLVTLRWTYYPTNSTTGSVTTVSYALVTNAGKHQLVRRYCTGGSTTPTRTTVIAPSVTSTGATVTCGNGTTYSACTTNDTDKSLKLTITPLSDTTAFSIDAVREVT